MLLLKICCGKANNTPRQGPKVTGLGQYSTIKKVLCLGKQDSASGMRGYRFRIVFYY